MIKAKGNGGGKGGKTRTGGGGGKLVVKKKKDMESPKEHILTLRSALFTESGRDKDVLADFPPFKAYARNGLNVELEFATRLPRRLMEWAVDLTERNLRPAYDSAGVAFDPSDLKEEFREQSNRFLVVREKPAKKEGGEEGNEEEEEDGKPGAPVGYVHFRFSMDGELRGEMTGKPALWVFSIQLEDKVKRKGLGRHVMNVIELMARKNNMQSVYVVCMAEDNVTEAFVTSKLRGFEEEWVDEEEEEAGDEVVYKKSFPPKATTTASNKKGDSSTSCGCCRR